MPLQQKICVGCKRRFSRKEKPSNFMRDKYCSATCRYKYCRGVIAPNYKHGLFLAGDTKNWREGKRLAENKRRAKINGGDVSPNEWEEIKKRYDYKCRLCRKNLSLTMDHRIPISRGGKHEASNIQPLCRSCNSHKKDRLMLREKNWLTGQVAEFFARSEQYTLTPQEWEELRPGIHMN